MLEFPSQKIAIIIEKYETARIVGAANVIIRPIPKMDSSIVNFIQTVDMALVDFDKVTKSDILDSVSSSGEEETKNERSSPRKVRDVITIMRVILVGLLHWIISILYEFIVNGDVLLLTHAVHTGHTSWGYFGLFVVEIVPSAFIYAGIRRINELKKGTE